MGEHVIGARGIFLKGIEDLPCHAPAFRILPFFRPCPNGVPDVHERWLPFQAAHAEGFPVHFPNRPADHCRVFLRHGDVLHHRRAEGHRILRLGCDKLFPCRRIPVEHVFRDFIRVQVYPAFRREVEELPAASTDERLELVLRVQDDNVIIREEQPLGNLRHFNQE